MQIFPGQMGRTSKLLVILQNSSPPLHSSASSGTRSESHSSYCNCIHQAALPPGCVHIRVPVWLNFGKHVLLFHFCTNHAFQGTPPALASLVFFEHPRLVLAQVLRSACPASMENSSSLLAWVPPLPALCSNVPSSERPSLKESLHLTVTMSLPPRFNCLRSAQLSLALSCFRVSLSAFPPDMSAPGGQLLLCSLLDTQA